jgi:hypothetical protein
VHHRLQNGTMIHVNVWMGPALPEAREAFGLLPPELGYKQIIGSVTR